MPFDGWDECQHSFQVDSSLQIMDGSIIRMNSSPCSVSWCILTTFPANYSATQKRHMVVRAGNYQLIVGQLYKLRTENILRRCVLDHERPDILWECHNGVAGGHVGGKATA